MFDPFDPLHKWFGIPPSEQPPDDYRLLGIARFEDDPDVIDAAADKHLEFLHELTNGEHGELAEQFSNRVSAARVRLLNPDKKSAYDEQLLDAEAEFDGRDFGGDDRKSWTPVTPANIPPPPGIENPSASPPKVVANKTVTATFSDAVSSDQAGAENSRGIEAGKLAPNIQSRPMRKGRWSLAANVWLFVVLPGALVLASLIGMIATGKLKLDGKKLESIGIPKEHAERIGHYEESSHHAPP